jgi:hypothetical protein
VCHLDRINLAAIFYIPPNATTRNLYVCLTPPKALHHLVGKDKYRKSTGTADLRKAKPIGARLTAEKLAEWDRLLNKASQGTPTSTILTTRMVEDVCARRFHHWLHLDDRGRYEGTGYDDHQLPGSLVQRMPSPWMLPTH